VPRWNGSSFDGFFPVPVEVATLGALGAFAAGFALFAFGTGALLGFFAGVTATLFVLLAMYASSEEPRGSP
jgi:hypothetical protein